MSEFDKGGEIPPPQPIKNDGPPDRALTQAEWAEAMKSFSDAVAHVVNTVRDAMRGANLLPEDPPTDPKERALWLKQRRNTGPEKPKNWRKR